MRIVVETGKVSNIISKFVQIIVNLVGTAATFAELLLILLIAHHRQTVNVMLGQIIATVSSHDDSSRFMSHLSSKCTAVN